VLIKSLTVENFRNFNSFVIDFDKSLNVISGLNGSGKTSLLEAVYYLSRGKSFRSQCVVNIVNHNQDELMLKASLVSDDIDIAVGISKNKSGKKVIRFNGKDEKTFKSLTSSLPLLLLDTDTHRQVASGSKHRRSIIDWGCFYHYPDFSKIWRDYNKTLAQRNYALKSGCDVIVWNDLLVEKAESLNYYRKMYCEDLSCVFKYFWKKFAENLDEIECDFFCGWNTEIGLLNELVESTNLDLKLGYTRFGPHRMDLKFNVKDNSAFQVLSQGQQKIMSYALTLAQGKLLRDKKDISCIYLIDDLPAELDSFRIKAVLDELIKIDSQVILTAINYEIVSQALSLNFKSIILD
jgi:DNA replication and repair protein RecF